MSKPKGIIVFGANGSGKTTIARELARTLDLKQIDHEDYCFEKSDIPYTVERSNEEIEALMLGDVEKFGRFVISACKGDFGDVIPQYYELAVYTEAPLELRIERVKRRGIERYGERVQKGGDMYEQQLDFVDFVANRPLSEFEEWAKTLTCPVIRIDTTEISPEVAAQMIKERFNLQ
ncbi:MAG: AAA family ATPase [Oscillospiraceae bacterium]|nr:AAA family ATPase [Oscillospiraceae bacterium]